MSNVDYSSCLSALNAEVNTYQNFVFLSLGVTLICSIVRSSKTAYFQENPATAAKVLFSFAFVKVILGIVLLAVFPGCPDVCQNSCSTVGHHFIYPVLVFAVAFCWFLLGTQYRKLAKTQSTAAAVVGAEEGTDMVETSGNKSKELV